MFSVPWTCRHKMEKPKQSKILMSSQTPGLLDRKPHPTLQRNSYKSDLVPSTEGHSSKQEPLPALPVSPRDLQQESCTASCLAIAKRSERT